MKDMWDDDGAVERLIARIELRLEQYRFHAEMLRGDAIRRQGAYELVRRVEARLEGLRAFKDRQRLDRCRREKTGRSI